MPILVKICGKLANENGHHLKLHNFGSTLAQSPILFQFPRLDSPQEAACQHGLRGLLGLPGLLDTGVAVSFLISEDAMFALIRGPGSPWEVQLTASTAEVGGMFVCPLLDPFRLWMTLKWVKLRIKVTQRLQVTTLPAIALRVARARAKARARCIIASWDLHAKTWGTIWIRLQSFLYFICTLAMCKDLWSWKAWCFPVQGPMECWQCGGGVYYHFQTRLTLYSFYCVLWLSERHTLKFGNSLLSFCCFDELDEATTWLAIAQRATKWARARARLERM